MTDQATPAKVRLTDGLGPLPEPWRAGDLKPDTQVYTADACWFYAARAVAEERERLQTAPRWIPVAERLPEKFTEVLVAFAGQVTLASTGQWTGSPHDHNGWCYPAENNGICDDGSDPVVTHWMPLPEVPKA